MPERHYQSKTAEVAFAPEDPQLFLMELTYLVVYSTRTNKGVNYFEAFYTTPSVVMGCRLPMKS
jgi:hypothetical protein